MVGWIKLHRRMLEWGWYKDPNTKAVFLHLLLRANRKTNVWRGISINRGQVVSSTDSLAYELGISIQSVRTALKRLKSTGEITIKPTNKYSIYTIANYNEYQATPKSLTSQLAVQTPTTNQQVTTDKKEDKENKEKNIENPLSPSVPSFDTFFSNYPNKRDKAEAHMVWKRLSVEEQWLAAKKVKEFATRVNNSPDSALAMDWLGQRRWL